MYFTKLSKEYIIDDIDFSSPVITYSKNKITPSVEFFKTNTLHKEKIFSYIPKEYRHYFSLLSSKINKNLNPHTDNGIRTNIIFYIKASNYVTTFYDICNDHYTVTQGNGREYKLIDVNPISSFIAKDNEVWVLDVSKPHSVFSLSSPIEQRISLTFSTGILYENVLKLLSMTDNL